MRGWLRAVARELRQGSSLVTFLGMAVLTAVLLWTNSAQWGARWNSLGSEIRDDMILLGPVAVVVGAWQGGRARRSDVEELVASTRRPFLAWHSAEIVALALALYAGVLIGLVTAAASILWVGGYGTWTFPAYVMGAFPTLLAYVAVGHLVGRVLAWRVVAPIAGVLVYLVFGFTTFGDERGVVLLGGGWLGGVGLSAFDLDAWALTALLAAAAAVALAGLGGLERRPARAISWMVAALGGLLVAGLAVPAALAATDSGKSDYPMVAHPALTCTHDGGPRVCVLREDQHLLAAVTPDARLALRRLRGIPGAPTWVGLGSTADLTRLDVYAGNTTPWGKPVRNPADGAAQVFGIFMPSYCAGDPVTGRLPGDEDGNAFAGADFVSSWLEPEKGPSFDQGEYPEGAGELGRRFFASSDAQRRQYAGRLHRAAVACDPAAARAAIDALAKP